jgi:hypothetical protein
LLLTHAADDFVAPDEVRTLIRDLREIRMSKLRKGFKVLGPEAGVKMDGVGGMEIAEVRGFIGGVIDGLRSVLRDRFITNTRPFLRRCVLTSSTERSIVLERRHGENERRKHEPADFGAVDTQMTTTMKCNCRCKIFKICAWFACFCLGANCLPCLCYATKGYKEVIPSDNVEHDPATMKKGIFKIHNNLHVMSLHRRLKNAI